MKVVTAVIYGGGDIVTMFFLFRCRYSLYYVFVIATVCSSFPRTFNMTDSYMGGRLVCIPPCLSCSCVFDRVVRRSSRHGPKFDQPRSLDSPVFHCSLSHYLSLIGP